MNYGEEEFWLQRSEYERICDKKVEEEDLYTTFMEEMFCRSPFTGNWDLYRFHILV